jgi:fumarate hydratase class II
MERSDCRQEQDSMGSVQVPARAYYGSQTQRAADNFFDSGLKPPRPFLYALARIKSAAALVNVDLGLLDEQLGKAIGQAANEILTGQFDDQFIVDLFQTGSGTSTHMNLNEVIASRANELLTGTRGGRSPVHPNDHVNLGQSSNDVVPSAIHVAAAVNLRQQLLPAIHRLQRNLSDKAEQFKSIRKIGRTHLQDALPIALGEEFSGYAHQLQRGRQRIAESLSRLCELPLGGTAVGTGANAYPEFAARVIAVLSRQLGIDFYEAVNHFEAQAARDAVVETSGALKTLAVSLVKIANDIRLMGSGPRCGLGELRLPEIQPGSSIMPGKINPVIPESVIQAAYQVMGNDTTIMLCGQAGNFELNVTMPLLAHNLIQSIDLLTGSCNMFAGKCIQGLEAQLEVCEANIEKSLALVTALVPEIGYDRAAEVAKKAHQAGKTIRQVVTEEAILPNERLARLLDKY